MTRVVLILGLVALVAVGCVAAAAMVGPAAGAIETQAEVDRIEAEASRLEAESELVDSRSVSQTQAALVGIAAAAIANADAARVEAVERADKVQSEYHELAIETIRSRRSWWPWAVVASVSIVLAVVVYARRPVQVVVIPPRGDGVEWVALPASGSDDLIPAVLRPQRGARSIRRV